MKRACAVIILAAGHGTRMKSRWPKVLHAVGGRPMLGWSVALARDLDAERVIVVGGAHSPDVAVTAQALGAQTVVQDPPQGTGHAVQCAVPALEGFQGDILVVCADTPLLSASTARTALALLDEDTALGVLGFTPEVPGAYGRLVLAEDGVLQGIVEAKDATPDELAISLCNSGVIAARADQLRPLLSQIGKDNAKGEYYLTDVVALNRRAGGRGRVALASADEVLGVNSRGDLAAAEAAFQARARAAALEAGVTLIAPETTFFAYDTVLSPDVVVEPHVVFGPGVRVEAGAQIRAFSHLEGCQVAAGASVGPYARLRPGAEIGEDAKVGNFVEIKKARLGTGAKASHLSYIGDATVGSGANIGAGTITCNYDGFQKHRTEIGANAFVGSNTSLVAPVQIGAGAYVGSGSVVTKTVEADELAVARARQRNIPQWAARFRARSGNEKD
ncbi:MAG: bifunctional UDP-N-acetylglucosamine diphosphorylase/glucosamine-1-phosphate N-acetyltransferase GlmU [Maricaulaceae bacterium]